MHARRRCCRSAGRLFPSKSSGIGREGVRYAIEELSQLKFTGFKV
jgi:hypothetical protein